MPKLARVKGAVTSSLPHPLWIPAPNAMAPSWLTMFALPAVATMTGKLLRLKHPRKKDN